MSARKRPATEELNSNSVVAQQPLLMHTNMTAVRNIWDMAAAFVHWVPTIFRPAPPPPQTYTEFTYESKPIERPDYRQTSEDRVDEAHKVTKTQKRLKKNHDRARSAGPSTSNSYSPKYPNLDTLTAHDVPQSRETLDQTYWHPKGHYYLDPLSNTRTQTTLHFEEDLRRHSDSSEHPLSSSSLSKEPFVLHPNKSHLPYTPRSQKQWTPRHAITTKPQSLKTEQAIEDELTKILIGDDEDSDDITHPLPLRISSTKKAQLEEQRLRRERLAREELERVEKERLEELRRKEEERLKEIKRLEDERLAEIKRKEDERLKAEATARLTRRLPKQPLIQPLQRKWADRVESASNTKNPAQVLTTSIGGTELRPKDFGTLLGSRGWLNDEIINSYIEWIVDAANKSTTPNPAVGNEKAVPKYIAHNSFFYENMTKKGPVSTDRLMKRKGAPGKSLLSVDTVIVPICRNSHWTVGVVRPFARTIEYFDSFGGQSRLGKEFIVHMRGWLKHQLGDAYIETEWKEPRTACASQSNGWDCGVFVCTNAFCVSFGLETSCYLERDMELQRRRIAAVLINRGFHGDFSWSNDGL